jgi:hypothetical protein
MKKSVFPKCHFYWVEINRLELNHEVEVSLLVIKKLCKNRIFNG